MQKSKTYKGGSITDAYSCDASNDKSIEKCLEEIKINHGKVDAILHSIAHANTEDLRNDFILTSLLIVIFLQQYFYT